MRIVKFLKLERDGVKEIAAVTFPGKWTGDVAVKENVCRMSHKLWDGKFDPTNEAHYKVLPQIFSGSRFWAVEVDSDEKELSEIPWLSLVGRLPGFPLFKAIQ